jgi:hypothetical protein
MSVVKVEDDVVKIADKIGQTNPHDATAKKLEWSPKFSVVNSGAEIIRTACGVKKVFIDSLFTAERDDSAQTKSDADGEVVPSTTEVEVLDYYDFEVLVRSDNKILAFSQQGEESGKLELDMNEIGIALQLIEQGNTNPQLFKDLGTTLYSALFPSKIDGHLRATRAGAETAGCGVRLRLVIEPPELAALPWEFLYHQVGVLVAGFGSAPGRLTYLATVSRSIPSSRAICR